MGGALLPAAGAAAELRSLGEKSPGNAAKGGRIAQRGCTEVRSFVLATQGDLATVAEIASFGTVVVVRHAVG
jgi:hypothetical protein